MKMLGFFKTGRVQSSARSSAAFLQRRNPTCCRSGRSPSKRKGSVRCTTAGQINRAYRSLPTRMVSRLVSQAPRRWHTRTYLCVVDCIFRSNCHWRRVVKCSTLRDMFRALGRRHTAADIYYFYLTRKIVARKVAEAERRKTRAKPAAQRTA